MCPLLEVVYSVWDAGMRVRCSKSSTSAGRGPGASFARAYSVSTCLCNVLLPPRSYAPPVSAATPLAPDTHSPRPRGGGAGSGQENRIASIARHRERRDCAGCCHESAPACRGSRQRAARATGSAGRHGWRVRARHQQDLTKMCGDAVSAREASAGTRRPASTDWRARRTLTGAIRAIELGARAAR